MTVNDLDDGALPVEYEAPAVTSRDDVVGLLITAKSDAQQDGAVSDINAKDGIVPVEWPGEYEAPAVASKEQLTAMLDTFKSDNPRSDVHRKENIVAVRWR